MENYTLNSSSCNLEVYAYLNKKKKVGILFLHGGPGSGAQPIMKLPAFKILQKEFSCVYFDQRGSGKSDYNLLNGLTIEDITNDVLLVTRDMKQRWQLDNVVLWGGSFGGCLASLCIERFASEFAGIILSSPAITFSRNQALDFFQRMQNSYADRLQAIMPKNTSKSIEPEQLFSSKELRDFVFSKYNPSVSLKHICAMSSWFYLHSFHNLFNKITIPTLIMQGKNDSICIYQNITNELKHTINPNIFYFLFENCGHAVFEDKVEEFTTKIITFIEEEITC